MTDQELFDSFCRRERLGRREDIENYPTVPAAPIYAQTRQVAEELIASARQHLPALPPICFDFIHSSKVNAVAFKTESRYFIGLNSGAMMMLNLVINRMLASPKVFTSVGNAAEEDDNIPPVAWDLLDVSDLWDMGVRFVLPRDKRRIVYARHLTEQAILFLIGHEIAHVTRGHIDYLANEGVAFIAELTSPTVGGPSLTRQAIEVDADRRSIIARCVSAMMTADHNQNRAPYWADTPRTAGNWQFDWAFAVNTFFRLFGDSRFTGMDLSAESYPPLALRRRLAIDTALSHLLPIAGETQSADVIKLLELSVQATESAFAALDASPAGGGLQDAETSEGRSHIERIEKAWTELHRELEPYSYESLSDE